MDLAFYAAAAGASAQQQRMSVIANNLANLTTTGFKKSDAIFANLIYNELNPPAQEGVQMVASSGVRLEKTNTDHSVGVPIPTGMPHDYMILQDGFFALQHPETGEITYTRDGTFHLSEQMDGRFLLTANNGKYALDVNGNPIVVTEETKADKQPLGVYRFRTRDGMLHVGDNEFSPVEKNGPAIVAANSSDIILQGHTEEANVNMAEEITKMIEAQRAYQFALKMVQTTDEVETTINSLR